MTKNILTQEELKKFSTYNPFTGVFTKIQPYNGSSKMGSYNSNGYLLSMVNGIRYPNHRLAWLYMTGEWPKENIDHINGIRSDNRFINLREASKSQNCQNCVIRKDNTTKYKGVTYFKNNKKYGAQICVNGKNRYLGLFNTALEASEAYINEAKILHKEFHRLVDYSHP